MPNSPYVDALVREQRARWDLPLLDVHPDDEMFLYSRSTCATEELGVMAYYRSGMVIADAVRRVADWWCPDGVGTYLDFACGYGRSLRFSIQDFGADVVWASDILPGAVDFVTDRLGAHGFLSATDPEAVDLGGAYDLIFVSSLFTHLPAATFVPWLRRLHGQLADGGLLVFSVHDEPLLPAGEVMPADGIWFQPLSEIESLDTADYGATVVTARFVEDAIWAVTGGASFLRVPRGLCFEQDLYLLPRHGLRTDRPVLLGGPQGALDLCRLSEEGTLQLAGWVATQDQGERVELVEIRLAGQLVGRVEPVHPRPDVAKAIHAPDADGYRLGWDVTVGGVRVEPSEVLLLTAITSSSDRGTFLALPLTSALSHGLASTRAEADDLPPWRRGVAAYRHGGLRRLLDGAVRSVRR